MLEEALVARELIRVEGLCTPLPPSTSNALLAWAQGHSHMEFIFEQYVAQGMRPQLTAFTRRAGRYTGVPESLRFGLDRLRTARRTSLEPHSPRGPLVQQSSVEVKQWPLSLPAAMPMTGVRPASPSLTRPRA